jgi:hypothetical protein
MSDAIPSFEQLAQLPTLEAALCRTTWGSRGKRATVRVDIAAGGLLIQSGPYMAQIAEWPESVDAFVDTVNHEMRLAP